MAGKYLVPCTCGQQVAVSTHQAGAQVTCACGQQVGVPPLRKLRELPQADAQPDAPHRKWSPRHALTVGGTSLVAGLLLWAGYLWSTEPPPLTFPEQRYAENIQGLMENGSPLQFWRLWLENRDTLADQGFTEIVSPQADAVEAYIAQRQLFRNILLGAAGAIAALTLLTWFAWPQSK